MTTCKCGCGGTTAKNREFVQGHDTKHASNLRVQANAGSQEAWAELIRREWLNWDERTFGVEIEFTEASYKDVLAAMAEVGLQCEFKGYTHEVMSGWKIVTDSSVSHRYDTQKQMFVGGLELVSPILRGKNGLRQLYLACGALKRAGAQVNKTCGLHVHHGIDDVKPEAVRNVIKAYQKHRKIIDMVMAPSRRACAPEAQKYANQYNAYEMGIINSITSDTDLRTVAQKLRRFRAINLTSYPKYGTIEFRQHQGTLDASKIAHWVMFGQGMIWAAKKGRRIIATTVQELAQVVGVRKDTREYLVGRQAVFAS